MNAIDDVLEKAEETGMTDAGQRRHFRVIAINSQEILIQIVGANAEEVNLSAKLIENKRH